MLAVTALVVLVPLAGVDIQPAGPGSGPMQIPIVAVATSAEPPPLTTSQRELFNRVPVGFRGSSCTGVDGAETESKSGPLAVLSCVDNEDGGPSSQFQDFPTAAALAEAFRNAISEHGAIACPDGQPSPGRWHYNPTPAVEGGSVFCSGGTVVWTRDADLLLGISHGGDLNAVYAWWRKYA